MSSAPDSERMWCVLSLKSAVSHCASGGKTSGSMANTHRGAVVPLLCCSSNAGKFPGSLVCLLSVCGRLFPGVLCLWAPLAHCPVVVGFVLRALFLPFSFFWRPTTCGLSVEDGLPRRGDDPRTVSLDRYTLVRMEYIRLVRYDSGYWTWGVGYFGPLLFFVCPPRLFTPSRGAKRIHCAEVLRCGFGPRWSEKDLGSEVVFWV